MKKRLILSFFVLGISSIVAQVVILRELTISFYGNEFFIGVVLASWLFWVALASKISEKILDKFKDIFPLLLGSHFLVGVFLFGEIFLLRFIKTWIGFPGEIPNLVVAFFSALFIPLPLCLILGGWWTVGTRIFSSQSNSANSAFFGKNSGDTGKDTVFAVNRAYFVETLGFILGGILFSFFFFQFQEFQTATFLILLNSATIAFLIFPQKGYLFFKTTTCFLFLIFIFFLFSPLSEKVNQSTCQFRFGKQNLIESLNSPYGNIAVTESQKQHNFYESGLLLGTEREIEFSEILTHLSLLSHPSPQKVLLIGGGFQGILNEILKHPIEKVYYLELDPKLIEIAKKYIPQENKKALENPKVKIITTDGRYFLKKTEQKFDVIIVNLPDPSTALLNRFYTQEFFQNAKEKLNENGIFTTYLTFSPSTPGKNLEELNISLYKTLKIVFSKVFILPEETNFFLVSRNETNENLTQNPQILIERFKQRKIKTKFLTEPYLNYRLSSDRIEKALNLFEKNKTAQINKDFFPISYFYQTLFWIDHFYFSFSKYFKNLTLSFWWIFAFILIIFIFFLLKRKKNLSLLTPVFSIACAGFSLMALEMIIIFAYQIIVGYLYLKIALLISALMAGIALGVWYGNRITTQILPPRPALPPLPALPLSRLGKQALKFHLFLIIFSGILILIFPLFSKIPLLNLTEIIFLVLAVLAGFLAGSIFPLANKIYLSSQPQPQKKTGTIYSADLIGSCFGAILPSLILIPVFGFFQTLIFIALVNLLVILILTFQTKLS